MGSLESRRGHENLRKLYMPGTGIEVSFFHVALRQSWWHRKAKAVMTIPLRKILPQRGLEIF